MSRGGKSRLARHEFGVWSLRFGVRTSEISISSFQFSVFSFQCLECRLASAFCLLPPAPPARELSQRFSFDKNRVVVNTRANSNDGLEIQKISRAKRLSRATRRGSCRRPPVQHPVAELENYRQRRRIYCRGLKLRARGDCKFRRAHGVHGH